MIPSPEHKALTQFQPLTNETTCRPGEEAGLACPRRARGKGPTYGRARHQGQMLRDLLLTHQESFADGNFLSDLSKNVGASSG